MSATKRYLFYFGYIGSRYCGIQKQFNPKYKDTSIAFYLEEGLLSLSPLNVPIVNTSSRTDAGVHAICSAFHCDLALPPLRYPALFGNKEDYITSSLNKFFEDSSLDIRIHKTLEVSNDVYAQLSAIRRTYLYRIAQYLPTVRAKEKIHTFDIPVIEVNRCHFVSGQFDIEAVLAACKLLNGTHDFRFYCKPDKRNEDKDTVRTLKLRVVPGLPLMNEAFDERYENLKFYDILAQSRGFLYNQIRRVVTVLIAVGKGLVSLEDVKETFDEYHFDCPYPVVGPEGLHLLSVEYPPHIFVESSQTK